MLGQGVAEAKHEQRARVLAEAFARNPEWFPHGRPVPKAVPTAVWINPPVNDVDLWRAENPMTRESRTMAIDDPAPTVEVVFGRDRSGSPSPMPEERCMAVAQ